MTKNDVDGMEKHEERRTMYVDGTEKNKFFGGDRGAGKSWLNLQ